jgi:hypothetical protein
MTDVEDKSLKCANAADGEKHEGPFYIQSLVRPDGAGHYTEIGERQIVCYVCAKKAVPNLPEPIGFTFRVG